jgi:hypothetical protein
VVGEDDGRAQPLDRGEEERRPLGVELRGRLVEEEELRLERERGREAHPLELAARQLGRPPAPEVERVHGGERPLGPWPDLRGRDAQVLEPERDLVGDDRHDHLVFRILEDAGDRPRELGGPRDARVELGDDHRAGEAAPVEVRHEARERAQERRLPRPGRAEQRHHLPRLELERDPVERRCRTGVREREVGDRR